MTLQQIKDVFDLHSYGRRHDLYCKKEPGVYLNQKYLCSIERNSFGQYSIIDQNDYHDDLDTLEKAVYDYVESLPYNSEFYNPSYRKGVFEQMVVSNYLRSLGHKDGYIVLKNVYGFDHKIHIRTNVDDYEAQTIVVKILDHISYARWVEASCERNADEIIKTIDGLLKPYLLGNIWAQLNVVQIMSTQNVDVKEVEVDELGFEKLRQNYKQQLIQELETMLDALKKNDV